MPLVLTSAAFTDGSRIPRRYTGDGENLSPALQWSGAPPGARSFALIVDDPDAPGGVFHHWAVFDIPAGAQGLDEGVGPGEPLRFGQNDFGHAHYDGPRPPHGHGPHRYRFRLLALDVAKLDAAPHAKVGTVETLALRHALAQGEIVGTYQR